MAKTTCPISRSEFREHAKPVPVKINEVPLMAEVKEFSTGSLGWYLNGKMTIDVGGKGVGADRPEHDHRGQQGIAERLIRGLGSRMKGQLLLFSQGETEDVA